MSHQTPRRARGLTGAPVVNRRTTTPAKTNANSLPHNVLAQLIVDLHNCGKNQRFVWHEDLYKEFGRDRVRKKFYYYRDIKLYSDRSEWDKCVKFAKDYIRQSESTMSEYV